MRLVADSGLWSTGPQAAPTPLVAVLEVSGAVLSWAIEDRAGAAEITFTDLPRADWQVDAQRQTNGTNPILGFTKQSTDAVLATVEPILKNSEAVVDTSFGYYEHAVATPSRKYVRDINKQVLDAVIPS